ncbi:MAG: ATP-binding protein [Elusimicrobia bacterium]|nr:ATP-binding protein [Elusimicrobiota bacterium]
MVEDSQMQARFRRAAAGLGFAVCALGLSVVAAWFLDLHFPKTYLPDTITMKFNTALSFACLGAALGARALSPERAGPWAKAAATLPLLWAAATMTAYLLRVQSIPLDQIFYPEEPGSLFTHHPGRMAPSTAMAFILASLALLIDGMKSRWAAIAREACSLLVLLTGFIILIGYLYFGRFLFTTGIYITPMAVPAAMGFTLLGAGLLLAAPEIGLTALAASRSNSGSLLRLLLPSSILIPVLMGWLRIAGEQMGLYGPEAGVTLTVALIVVVLGCFIYISARSMYREEMEKARYSKRLEEANADLEAFTYSVSHDLRAPLRGIEGFAKILQEDYGPKLDQEGRRVIGVMMKSTARMALLIDELLAFARVSRTGITKARIDMTALAKEAWEEAAPERQRGLCAIAGLPPAAGDKAMLRQVWINLFSNALKFTSKTLAPEIAVSWEEEGGFTVYTVRDNGAGFDPGQAKRLFGIFQRLHSETEFEGIGVGLALSNMVVAKHGGWMRAEGSPGKGAVVRFALPAAAGVKAS